MYVYEVHLGVRIRFYSIKNPALRVKDTEMASLGVSFVHCTILVGYVNVYK